jgi:hypothetical protein
MLCHRYRKLQNHQADMDGASVNTVGRSETQISQVEYKVSRHWAANNDVALREALREKTITLELRWVDNGQLCWKRIRFEWAIREDDGDMVVVPTLPDIDMPSRHKMGLLDPPSYMRFNTDRLVDLYYTEPMPDWLGDGMEPKYWQSYLKKLHERNGILVSCIATYRISAATGSLATLSACTAEADDATSCLGFSIRRIQHCAKRNFDIDFVDSSLRQIR